MTYMYIIYTHYIFMFNFQLKFIFIYTYAPIYLSIYSEFIIRYNRIRYNIYILSLYKTI